LAIVPRSKQGSKNSDWERFGFWTRMGNQSDDFSWVYCGEHALSRIRGVNEAAAILD
jgi:hypothetical protein